MSTGFPSYSGSPWVNRRDDYSPDSGFNSAYSSTFGSTGSRLGSSQDVDIHSSSKFGEFVHGKSPSWPVTHVTVRPSPGHAFPSSRSTSWPGQMKTDVQSNSAKSFFGVAGKKYSDTVADVTCPGERTGDCDLASRATHLDETLSPESARKIFREAAARNERLRSDRYSASFLHSTPEKPHKVFLRPSPSLADKSCAVSMASGYDGLYEEGTGSCSSSSLREFNDLTSCGRKITLPREHASSYEILKCSQGTPKHSDEVENFSTGGAMRQFGLRTQVCHRNRSPIDRQNSDTSHRISGTPSDHQVPSGLSGDIGRARDFTHPSCDLSKLTTPVQLQRQWSDWNQKPVRSDHSPDASPRGFVNARAGQSLHNDALIRTSRSPNESTRSALVTNESLSKSHRVPDGTEDVESKKVLGSVVQQIERLSLSRTSVLRKLSHEFYGQSAKHNHGLVNAILRAKPYRRFGSVDETGHEVTDDLERSPLAPLTFDGDRRQSAADFRSPFLKLCQNGNGVSPSGVPEGFAGVGVVATTVSPTTGCHLPSVPETNIGLVDGPGVNSSYHPDTHFQKKHPDERFEKKILPVGVDDRNVTMREPHDSPPPPDLPPRKYRESGDAKSMPISGVLQGQGLDLLGTNDEDNFDSTAAADDYAEQLRRQAKRLSHSHSSIFTLIHSPRVEQVALPSDHGRKLVDHANQESSSSQSTGFFVESFHGPIVERFLLQSSASPNSGHCEIVPNGGHAVTSSIDDKRSTVLTENGVKESPGLGNLHEQVTTRKHDKISCAKNLFGSEARLGGKSSVSDGLISVEERNSPDPGRKRVSYVRSRSSPENQGSASKGIDSCNEIKSVGMERKSGKDSSGERNHLAHEGRCSALEAASLIIDSGEGCTFSYKQSNSSSHERNILNQERQSASQERRGASQGRKSASQERKGASQEIKSVNQERKTLSPEELVCNRGRKTVNKGRIGIDSQRNHSNEERRILSHEWNGSSVERQRNDTNKNVHSNQERSLSHDRKTGGCEGHSAVKIRKDLNQELLATMFGNGINRTCRLGIHRSPEEEKSLRGETDQSMQSSHKRGSGIKKTGLNFSSDEVPSGCSPKAEDATEKQRTTDISCEALKFDLGVKRFELKSRPMCDESDTNFGEKAASPGTSKRETWDKVSHVTNSSVHAQRNRNREKVCKIVNDMEPHRDCHLKEKIPTVNTTELISTSCDANNTLKKPLNSAVNVVSSRQMKLGNPMSEVGMTKAKLVHFRLEGNAVIRENRAEQVIDNADIKPVGTICEKDSPTKASVLLNGKQGTALAEIQDNLNPCYSQVQEEIPSFLSDVLPVEHKTATYYLAQPAFNNILSRDAVRETCLPAVRTSIQPFLRYLSEKAVASSTSFENQESSSIRSKSEQVPDAEELSVLQKIDDKLKDFEREKQSIESEVIENVALGHKLTALAEEKLEPKEFGKFKLYVDEMDKVLCLLLNVTKRLSNVETSIKSLSVDESTTNERSALVSKRADLSQKYEDALALSEGIALRKHQVSDYLVKCLSDKDFKSFEHFVEAKLRLFLEKQTIEDIVTVVESKLRLLRSSDGAFD